MTWLGWLWTGVLVIFFAGIVLIFTSPPLGKREGPGCLLAGVGFALMIVMLFVTAIFEPR